MTMEIIKVQPKAQFDAYIVEQQRSVGMEQGHTAQPGDYLLVGADGTLHHFSKSEFEQMFDIVDPNDAQKTSEATPPSTPSEETETASGDNSAPQTSLSQPPTAPASVPGVQTTQE